MIETIEINAIEEIVKLLMNSEYNKEIKRTRSNYLYRGLLNKDFRLVTSLDRNCGEKGKVLEVSLLRNFKKYALADNALIDDSVWTQLTIGQHHGLPTRMLDWTYSPLMALNFAVSEQSFNDLSKHDCAIWAIDISEMNSLLPSDYMEELEKEKAYFFTIDMLDRLTKDLEKYDNDMRDIITEDKPEKHSAMVLLEPPSIDQRIINQYSYFSVIPSHMTDIEAFLGESTEKTKRYIISKDIRWEIRDLLDTLNINERIVYPGLDGVAAWLKRHYFVKR